MTLKNKNQFIIKLKYCIVYFILFIFIILEYYINNINNYFYFIKTNIKNNYLMITLNNEEYITKILINLNNTNQC